MLRCSPYANILGITYLIKCTTTSHLSYQVDNNLYHLSYQVGNNRVICLTLWIIIHRSSFHFVESQAETAFISSSSKFIKTNYLTLGYYFAYRYHYFFLELDF